MKNSPVVIRDPVHGDIELTGEEITLLDTWPMQRLRGIHQLGTARLVYPGATHTRFEHSIGTLHMTSQICRHMARAARARPADLVAIDPGAERILRLAALVHDLGHIPFGHNLEDQTGLLPRHDTASRMAQAVTGAEVGELLQSYGVLDEVLAVLGAGEMEVPPSWSQVLSDTICADILDYLARDSLYTGLTLQYDRRVLGLFCVDRESGDLFINTEKRGMLREDALSEVIRVLEARYYFSERVYYHHAKITAGALIARAVEEALESGDLAPARLGEHTDDSLVEDLVQRGRGRAAHYATCFRRRLLPKRAAVYPSYLNRELQPELIARFFDPAGRSERIAFEREVEGEVQRRTGSRAEVMLYCPGREMQLKESGIKVRMPGHPGLRPLSSCSDRVPRVADLEESYRNLWKLYLLCLDDSPRVLQAAATAAGELLPEAVNAFTLKRT